MNEAQVENLVTPESLNGSAPVTFNDVAAASAEKDVAARTTTVLKLVSTPLTQEQRALANDLQAQTWREIKAAKATRATEAADWREKIAKLEKDMDRFAEEAETGIGSVEVECLRLPVDGQNAWRFVRKDTGETVCEEPMTAEDRQAPLPFGDAEVVEAEDLLAMAREAGGGDDEDDENAIDDPEALLEGAAEEEAPKKRSRKARG